MGVGLEGVNEVNQVGVMRETSMALQLFEAIIDRQGAHGVRGGCLGNALDCNFLVGLVVVRNNYHAKGAVIQWCHGPEATIQDLPSDELVLHGCHGR